MTPEPSPDIDGVFPAADPSGTVLGAAIGHYTISGLLGEGGMGRVYRARDGKLGREVAIKILPRAFVSDPDRVARFRREAHVLAALNHPNIAAIYGVEDGLSERGVGVHALVLELIEGETLADRVARGPLPLAEVLAIARQIRDALDTAHEKGIVHRDLKPANIKVTQDGVVKVLDFGLAKAASQDGTSSGLTHSPTVTVAGTRHGVILGTAAYMSPEQARGLAVDKRADIWAFGCILFELLTGRAAFARATTTDTLAAIVSSEPQWDLLPSSLPADLRRLLDRCLQRDLRHRLRDIGDAQLDVALDTGASRATDAHASGPSARVSRGLLAVAIAVGFALVAAGAALGWFIRKPVEQPAVTARTFTRLTWDSTYTTQPSISADGRLIAFASDRSGEHNRDIWVQQTSGGLPLRLTSDPADESQPTLSPDGAFVVFRSEHAPAGLYIVSALGGEPRLLALDGRGPKFSPDGRSVAFWTGNPPELAPRSVLNVRKSFVVPSQGGEPVEVKTDLASLGDPVWSPDGRALIVFGRRRLTTTNNDTDWWWVARDGSSVVRTGAYERFAASDIDIRATDDQPFPEAWTNNGVFFVARIANSDARPIWTIDIDPATGHVAGAARRITTGSSLEAAPAVANDGRLVFASVAEEPGLFGLPLDSDLGRPTGALIRLRGEGPPVGRASLSQDGTRLAFFSTFVSNTELVVRDMPTGRERQLAVTPPSPLNPVISPNGTWVGYTVRLDPSGGQSGRGTGYLIAVDGGTPRKVCDDCELFGWTPDSTQVLLVSGSPAAIRILDAQTTKQVTLVAPPVEDRPMVSPDGRWISWNGDGIHVAPFRGAAPVAEEGRQTIQVNGRTAGWSPDSHLLYVLLQLDGFRCLYAFRVDPQSGRLSDTPQPVHHFHEARLTWGSTGYGSAVVKGWFLANLWEHRGNIWTTTLDHRQ